MRLPTLVLAAAVLGLTAAPAFPQLRLYGACGVQNSPGPRVVELLAPARMQPVTGVPYAVVQSTEEVRTLSDGTHITKTDPNENAMWRDSAGRTRAEAPTPPGLPERCEAGFAEIADPVGGYLYLLDTRNQVAHRAPLASADPISGVGMTMPWPPSGDGVTSESLGTKTMLGVKAAGCRVVTEAAAGQNGAAGRRALTTEYWTVPGIIVDVYRKTTIPAEGLTVTMTAQSLSTAEPDPALFQVPAGYRVVDETADKSGGFHYTMGGTPAPRTTGCSLNYPVTIPSRLRPVTGAPFSARESSVATLTRADGSTVPQPGQPDRLVWRDSSGRERTTVAAPTAGPVPCAARTVRIEDPVGGYRYVLDTVNRVAHRVVLKAGAARTAADVAAEYEGAKPAGGTTEKLGSKMMSGVVVIGIKDTLTIPIGKQGNDGPLTSTNERWFSPQLGAWVYRTDTDPNGTRTLALLDLSTAEPDPALFQVPEGYKIVDETGRFTITFPKDAGAKK